MLANDELWLVEEPPIDAPSDPLTAYSANFDHLFRVADRGLHGAGGDRPGPPLSALRSRAQGGSRP